MRVALVCKSFDKNSGQGVYKMAGYLADSLRAAGVEIVQIQGSILSCLLEALKTKADIYHVLVLEASWPILFRRKSIATLHDAIIYKVKERRWLSTFYMKLMYNLAKLAKHAITISDCSKKDIMYHLNVPADKISTHYLGVDHAFFRPTRNIKNKTFTVGYVGGLGKRKNVELIIAVAKLLENSSIRFKIAGVGPQLENLKALASGLGNIDFLGFIDESKLPDFYNSLDVLVFPSLYEGFGMPVSEAMACGVPVVSSNASCMPEIIGDAGVLLPPNDANRWAEAISDLSRDAAKLAKLRKLSIARAKMFDWSETARSLLQVYDKVLKQ